MNDSEVLESSSSSNGAGAGPADPAALRVVLLADDDALRSYGPVLRRLVVGLIDEVGDLNLLCLGTSAMLKHVPSPPVRLISEAKHYPENADRIDYISREVIIKSPPFDFFETLWPRRQAARIADVLSTYKPTLLHALSERQVLLAQDLSKLLEIPYVISLLSLENGDIDFSDDRCGKILPCNSRLARQVRQKYPRLAPRVQVLPIGTHVVDLPCCFENEQLRPQIFCCGRFDYGHGFSELINVAKRLSMGGYTFGLTLAGCGPGEHELRQHVEQLKLAEYVTFVPPLETMLSDSDVYKMVLQSADIFVQPWPEKMWRPELLEAMSVGNAVVAAEGVENDLVINGKTALTVKFHDEQAMTDALEKLLKDHEYARSLGRTAQEYLRKHFLASRMIARLGKAYHQSLQVKNTSA